MIKRLMVSFVIILLAAYSLNEDLYANSDIDCLEMVLLCWITNPYEPGTTAHVIFNDACETAGVSCIKLQSE